jgi:hypothetical protein
MPDIILPALCSNQQVFGCPVRGFPLVCSSMIDFMIRVVRLSDIVEQDEDVWCASTPLRPSVGAVGDGPAREAAIADLRAALDLLLEDVDWTCEPADEGPQSWEGK